MRAALYLRVSTRDGKQDPDNQRLQLHQLCKAQGWEIGAEYTDHETGSESERVEFRRMLQDASTRRWDMLIFWSLDRFTREGTLATLKYLELLESYGVRWRSFTEPWIDSAGPFRDVIISLLASLAKQERIRIRERVAAGLERYRQEYSAGKVGQETQSRSGKNLPVGRPKRVFDRQQVIELRQQGLSLRKIAHRLSVGEGTVQRVLQGVRNSTAVRQKHAEGLL
jgi:DNA invertase Pin-like site-specific DNA recombinase